MLEVRAIIAWLDLQILATVFLQVSDTDILVKTNG